MKASSLAVPLSLLLAVPAIAATGMDKTDTATLNDSVTVLNALADAPDKGIPQELFAKDANKHLYGEKTTGAEILMDSKLGVPAAAKPVMDSIRRHMANAVAKEAAEKAKDNK